MTLRLVGPAARDLVAGGLDRGRHRLLSCRALHAHGPRAHVDPHPPHPCDAGDLALDRAPARVAADVGHVEDEALQPDPGHSAGRLMIISFGSVIRSTA